VPKGSLSKVNATPAKLKGFQQVLDRDGRAFFKNGARAKRTKWGGLTIRRHTLERTFSSRQLEAAWLWAMNGDQTPAPAKLRPPTTRRDWGNCPF